MDPLSLRFHFTLCTPKMIKKKKKLSYSASTVCGSILSFNIPLGAGKLFIPCLE